MQDAVRKLISHGVLIPSPDTVFIDADVVPERIASGVTIGPGSRLSGARTLLLSGARIGTEGPADVRDCALGAGVTLASGSFSDSVFFSRSSIGPSAHVRFGTLLDEGASAAHAVGLKQTLLLPYATLGSVINFCDALLAGGSTRDDHSEVGSGFIHFNFTPHGDKATPSLFGNVREGVFMRSPRIFLGGAGGAVGPMDIGFGTVLAAGSVYRKDRGRSVLVYAEHLPDRERPFDPNEIRGASRRVRKNLAYMAELVAYYAWLRDVRAPFHASDAGEVLLGDAALALLRESMRERLRQLGKFADLAAAHASGDEARRLVGLPERLKRASATIEDLDAAASRGTSADRDAWVGALDRALPFLDAVRAAPDAAVTAGRKWLDGIVERWLEDPVVRGLIAD